jgi:hypothetical protein
MTRCRRVKKAVGVAICLEIRPGYELAEALGQDRKQDIILLFDAERDHNESGQDNRQDTCGLHQDR